MMCRIRTSILLVAVAGLALLISGCGGSTSANVVTVSVTPSGTSAIAGQVVNLTASVGGSTTLTVTWTCTYVYTPLPTTTTPNPTPISPAKTCNSGDHVNGGSIGTWVISDTNGSNVLTYTAPSLSNFPNPIPTITFTAAADADKKKTGTGVVGLDSGIRVSISPTTATVPVGISPAQKAVFSVSLQNTDPSTVTYAVVQPNSSDTKNTLNDAPNPLAQTCDPTCGSISNGVYTAPTTLPTDTKPAGSKSTTPTTVYVVAWSTADPTHFNVATITLVNATTNPETYTGLSPSTVAAGGVLQDVFLNAKNVLNTTQIAFVPPPTLASDLTETSGSAIDPSQKFTIPISSAYCTPSAAGATTTITCDASIMTRVRLQPSQLAQAEPDSDHPAWILIRDIPVPNPPAPVPPLPCKAVPTGQASTTTIACPLHIVNASPALVAAIPDSFPQGSTQGTIPVGAIGGYYGSTGALVNLSYNGQTLLVDNNLSSLPGPRSVFGSLDTTKMPSPGLYEVAITSTISSGTPLIFKTAITNAAVQPNFALAPTPTSLPLTSYVPSPGAPPITNLAPSAIALDSTKGFAVIAEQATNTLQFVSLGAAGPSLLGSPIPMGGTASAPTDIAIDDRLYPPSDSTHRDLAIVVSSGDSTLYLYSVTATGSLTSLASVPVDLNTLLQQPTATGLPLPVSFGVDPGTHLGVVAYQNTNVAFIVDVNPNSDGSDTRACFIQTLKPPCVVAPVAVNTGTWPKVVMQPNVPLGYITPGGGTGVTSVVNLLQTGTTVPILPFSSTGGTSGATRTAGITLIHTQKPHGINPISGGTVIIAGIMPTGDPSKSNFNGTFNVIPGSVSDPYTFSYSNPGPDDVEKNTSSALGSVQYGTSYYSFSTTPNASGAVINPITRTFAYADFNQASGQIGFISTLDQSLTSLSLSAGSCNGCQPSPAGAPELGFRSVAFDPFTNVLIAFNPSDNSSTNFAGNEISLINPGGPAAGGTTNFPYRIIAGVNTGQVGTGSYTPSGATTPVTVYGPMAYDPKTKYVLIANAGSNNLTSMSLDPGAGTFQKAHIQDLQLPPNSCPDISSCYAVPVAQPKLGSLSPAKTCSFTDPSSPCMPQAVQLGKDATIRLLGQGFLSLASPLVRLDAQTAITPPGQTQAVPIPAPTIVSDAEIDVTIPAALLFTPHDYAVDVQSQKTPDTTNAIDLHVVGLLDMTSACQPTAAFPQGPAGVAIDQTRHIALVTNYACNIVSVVSIDPTGAAGPFGTIIGHVAVGNQPLGVAVIPRLNYAVVTNNGDTPNGTASIIDITNPASPQIVPIPVTSGTTTTNASSVTVGFFPLGVAIDQDRALALVANSGSSTLSAIDLTGLLPSDPSTSTSHGHVMGAPSVTTIGLSGPPTAIAIDPNRAIAVVTNLQNANTNSVTGGLDVVSLSTSPLVKSSTSSVSSLSTSLTGIVYDPAPSPALFYATSTQQNAIYSFNPDTGSVQTIRVGINPYSLGYNYQTGSLLTINSTSNSSSAVDAQNFKTRQTLGISSMSQFAIDVDTLTNIAVIADQNNNRLVFLAMPK